MILINSSPKNALKIFQPFIPIFVPVGIGCLLADIDRKGIKAKFIDIQVENNVLGLVKQYVKEMDRPYIFGFSVLTVAFKNAILVSRELKKLYPDSIIVFGGIHPTAIPDECLSYEHIDVIFQGEAEKSLIEFYKCVKAGKDFKYLDNICYKENGQVLHNRRNFILDDLDNYPSFPYHLFNSKPYDFGFILTSRGCPYRCIFCSNTLTSGRKYRFRSAKVITQELAILCHKYNRRYVQILDDNFLVNKERVYLLIDEINKKGLDKKMTFNFQARGDSVDLKLLERMYDAGFRSIFFGIETASDRLMKIIKKNETVDQCIKAVQMAKKIGFHVSATFMYALPGETHQDRMDCVRLTRELNLDMVRYNNATPYPGTKFYYIAKKENRLNIQGLYENFVSVSTFIEYPFKKIPFSYVPESNSENEIRRDLLFSYFSFYFSFSMLKKIFARPDLGAAWFNAGEQIIAVLRKMPAIIFLGLMLSLKFCQLFYYSVLKKETRISLKYFLQIFNGLWRKNLYD